MQQHLRDLGESVSRRGHPKPKIIVFGPTPILIAATGFEHLAPDEHAGMRQGAFHEDLRLDLLGGLQRVQPLLVALHPPTERPRKQPHQTADHRKLAPLPRQLQLQLEPPGIADVVSVHAGQPCRRRQPTGLIERLHETAAACGDQPEPGVAADHPSEHPGRLVDRAVVDRDDLEVLDALRQQGRQALLQPRSDIPQRQQDADSRRHRDDPLQVVLGPRREAGRTPIRARPPTLRRQGPEAGTHPAEPKEGSARLAFQSYAKFYKEWGWVKRRASLPRTVPTLRIVVAVALWVALGRAAPQAQTAESLDALQRKVHLLETRLREARRPPRPFQWRSYGPREGLASTEVYQLLEAPDDTLYAGGIRGLHQFDGLTWRTIPGVSTRCHGLLFEPATGTLWAGFEGGLYRLDPRGTRLRPVPFETDTRPLRTPAPGLDAQGRLWVTSAEGLFLRGPDGRFRIVPTPQIESLAYATAVYPSRAGPLLLGAESGLFQRLDDANPRWAPVPGGPHARVLDLAEDDDGRLFVATAHGLWIRDAQGAWRVLGEDQGLPTESCSALAYSGGVLWIGTWSGLCALRQDELSCFDRKDGLGAGQVRDVLVDRRGLVWAGTRGGGVSSLNVQLWSRFGAEIGIPPGQVVYSHHMDGDGTIWFEAGQSGLVRVAPDGTATSVPVPGLVRSVTRDRLGRLWAGLQESNPVIQQPDGSWQALPGREARGAYFLVPGPQPDEMWIGTYWNGLFRWRDGQLTHWGPDRLGHGFVRMLHLNATGTLTVATLNGDLWLVPSGSDRLERWRLAERLPSTRVQAMAEAADGSLWLGTDRGAVLVRDTSVSVFTTQSGLADDDVRAIHQDRTGRLWFGTAKGLSLYRRSDLDDSRPSRRGARRAGHRHRRDAGGRNLVDGLRRRRLPAAWRRRGPRYVRASGPGRARRGPGLPRDGASADRLGADALVALSAPALPLRLALGRRRVEPFRSRGRGPADRAERGSASPSGDCQGPLSRGRSVPRRACFPDHLASASRGLLRRRACRLPADRRGGTPVVEAPRPLRRSVPPAPASGARRHGPGLEGARHHFGPCRRSQGAASRAQPGRGPAGAVPARGGHPPCVSSTRTSSGSWTGASTAARRT